MIEGGFIATALAFVGILPAHRLPSHPAQIGPLPLEDSPRRSELDMAATNITRLNSIDRGSSTFKRGKDRVSLPPASTPAFINWLREINEFGEMPQRRLLSLYAEFCETAFEPVSTGRLMRQLVSCGVVKRRIAPKVVNGKYHSPTVYRVLPDEQTMARAA